eukprot:8943407-Pyramimonas_sp.AAC.1
MSAASLEHWLRKAAWNAKDSPAIVSASGKGVTGGVGMMVAGYGMSEVETVDTVLVPGRVTVVHVGGLCPGGFSTSTTVLG